MRMATIFDLIEQDYELSKKLYTFALGGMAVMEYCVSEKISYLRLYLNANKDQVMSPGLPGVVTRNFAIDSDLAGLAKKCEEEMGRQQFGRYLKSAESGLNGRPVASCYYFNDKSEEFREKLFEFVNGFPPKHQ